MSIPVDINDRLEAAALRAEGGGEIIRRFANDPEGVSILTESGAIPSLAEWLRLNAVALGGVPALIERVTGLEESNEYFIGDKAVLKAGATTAHLAAAIAAGREVVIPDGVNIVVDNSAGVGLTITQDNVKISGRGRITCASKNFTAIRSTGKKFNFDFVEVVGPGTHDVTHAGGNPPAMILCEGEDAIIYKARFTDPFGAGVLVKQAAGAKVLYCDFTSTYAGGIATPFLFHIYLRVASDFLVKGCTLNGSIQGICGGGDDSGTLTVLGKDGITSSKVRNGIIDKNFVNGQLDHSIYFSNSSENITTTFNLASSINPVIKIEGGPNLVKGNICRGGEGLQGRNVFDTDIDGNEFYTSKSGAEVYGILLFDQVFKRPCDNVKVRNNTCIHSGLVSAAGIFVMGGVWDGYQSVLSNIDLSGNTVKGYGNITGGFGIGVSQRLFAGAPVAGSWGVGFTVHCNTIEMPAGVAVVNYGMQFDSAIRGLTGTGNTIRNFQSQGVRLLGVADAVWTGNTLTADPAAVAAFGFFERQKDSALHFDSVNNNYGNNTYKNITGRKVQQSDQTTFNSDRVIVRRAGVLSADTVLASQWPYIQVYSNHTAGAVITLENSVNSPWPIDKEITIANAHAANSLTVNPGGHTVVAGARAVFVCTGGNAFIRV